MFSARSARDDAQLLVDERHAQALRRLPAPQVHRLLAHEDATPVRVPWPDSILTTVLFPAPL